MASQVVTPVALMDLAARSVRCCRCRETITGLVWRSGGFLPAFSGEWREGDDHVWRLTDYARSQRRRRQATPVTAASLQATRRRPWAEPALWRPVIAHVPGRVECGACGTEQVILGVSRRP